ncbi:MAG TPA: protein kinase [Gemmatimonadales bacterium]|nr:protein kinase [Gemmatimonadales bacterium]
MPELVTRLQQALADRYRIDGEIGAGGMATVFLAQDLRHDRKVALKLLRPELSAVIGAERFLAEIKLTANLQHPHILPLFDSGEADSHLFYVMPFVEGESLRSRLNREKQLPVAEAVRIATEVASALDYAHRHGVVHRDIKPENILLHDGRALVADFGIALAASKAGGNRMTETGMSLGTPHYMSPEQAMGEREITPRSDVYALGVVLYEMLTGDPPFTGSTAQAVVARVLTEAPRPILPQRHTIPPEVEAAVLTALEKLPADRFGSAAEFAQALAGRGTGGSMARTAATPAQTATEKTAMLRPDPVKIGLCVALAAAAAVAAWGWLRSGPAPTVNRFSVYLPPDEALASVTQSGNRVAISPDGLRLVYVGAGSSSGRLMVRDHDKLTSTPISGTDGGASPFFSPDGRSVGFIVGGTKLRTAPLDGGPTQSLSDSINATAADWGSDGYIYVESDSGISRIRASGGPLETVYSLAAHKQVGAEWPLVLPGAKGLVFRTRLANQSTSDFNIVGMTLPHGEPHVLTRGVLARYSPTGHLLVLSADGKLVGLPFDVDKVAITGPPVGLLEGIGIEVGGFSANLGLSNTGTLIYTTGAAARARRPVWVTREGLEVGIDSTWEPQGTIGSATISPDGRALAVDLQQNGINSIWIKQLPFGPFSRLTFGDTANLRPTWSPDGRSLIYIGNASAPGGRIMRRRADGTGTAELLTKSPFAWAQALSTPDGRWILARRSVAEAGNGDIYGIRVGDSTVVPLVTGPATEAEPAVSPDGRWMAYTTTESGTPQVYVRPFPDVGSARWQVSTSDGRDPLWSHSGRELFYLSPTSGKLMSVAVKPGATFAFDQPRPLFSTVSYVPGTSVAAYDVSPDDKRFLFLRETAPNDRSELIVVQNWTEELKQRSRK